MMLNSRLNYANAFLYCASVSSRDTPLWVLQNILASTVCPAGFMLCCCHGSVLSAPLATHLAKSYLKIAGIMYR